MDAQLPPQSAEAERAILGAILRDADVYDDVRGIVGEADFYHYPHQVIYRHIAQSLDAGKPMDYVLLAEGIKAAGHIEDIGGYPYIVTLWQDAATGANAEYHARLIRDKAARRRLIHLCGEVARDATDLEEPAEQLVARFEQQVFDVAAGATSDEPTPLFAAAIDVVSDVDARQRGEGPIPISTRLTALDEVLGGLHRQRLIVLAARPSVGKSALLLQFALAGAKAGVGVFVVSLEMSAKEFASRALACSCDVPLNQITGGSALEKPNAQRLANGVGQCRQPIWIDDRPHHTAATITSAARRAVRKHKVGLVVIDYLQLIDHGDQRYDSHAVRVGRTAWQMKVLARQLNVPVVLLCQMNREVEKRGDGKPQLSDLRDSGEIEQHCDDCLMLWPQDILGQPDGSPSLVQEIRVCVEKQRNGPKGIVSLEYERQYTRFRDAGIPM